MRDTCREIQKNEKQTKEPLYRVQRHRLHDISHVQIFFFIASPLRGVRFRRSRKAAPDCRASMRLSITPVSSPSVREQRTEAENDDTITGSTAINQQGEENHNKC